MTVPRYLDLDAWQARMVAWACAVRSGGKRLHTVPSRNADGSDTQWMVLAAAFEARREPVELLVREPWKHASPTDWMHLYWFESGIDDRVVTTRAAMGLEPLPVFEGPWLAPETMPDEAVGYRLQIIAIWPRKLHDMTQNDACDEGLWHDNVAAPPEYRVGYKTALTSETIHPLPLGAFRERWDGLYGASSWDSNPSVLTIKFKALLVGRATRFARAPARDPASGASP